MRQKYRVPKMRQPGKRRPGTFRCGPTTRWRSSKWSMSSGLMARAAGCGSPCRGRCPGCRSSRCSRCGGSRRTAGSASQPFQVTWPGAPRRISHTPDYFARLEDCAGDQVKFSVTEAMCREMGCWSYALVHEPDRWRWPRSASCRGIGIRATGSAASRNGSWTHSATRGCSWRGPLGGTADALPPAVVR